MAITPLPPAPEPTDSTAQFNSKAFAWVGSLDQFTTETNALAVQVDADKTTAVTAKNDAQAAEAGAVAAANVTKWVSGTTYAEGAVVWSPVTFVNYRRKIAGGGTTDPSLDATNWEQVTGTGTGDVTLNGIQTLTNKTIAFSSNTLTNVASTNTSQTLTNKTIAFSSNTLTDVASTNTSQTLTNKTLTDPAIIGAITEDIFTITDGAAFEIDPSNGSIQLITLGANRTPKATNFAAGESVTLMVDDGSAYTITWTDATFGGSGVVWKTEGGQAPLLNVSGYTVMVFWKVGTQVYGVRVGNA